jgi:WD40 repeat protein
MQHKDSTIKGNRGFLFVLVATILVFMAASHVSAGTVLASGGPHAKISPRAWGGITALAISPDGNLVSSAGKDGSVRLWNSAGGEKLSAGGERLAIQGHSGAAVTGVSFDPNGKRLFSVGRDSVVRSWDVSTGKQEQTFLAHEQPIRAIAVSNNGQYFATAGEETRIMLWDAKTGKLTAILSDPRTAHRDFVNALAFSQNGKLLASAGADGRIVIWELPTGKPLRTLLGHAGEVNTVVFSVNDKLLVSGGADSTVKVWDVATGTRIHDLLGHQGPVRSVAISPNQKTVASGGEDSRILWWDIETGKLLKASTGNTNFINALVFEPNGQLLAGDEDDHITTWDVETGQKIDTVEPIKAPIKPSIEPQSNRSTGFLDGSTSQRACEKFPPRLRAPLNAPDCVAGPPISGHVELATLPDIGTPAPCPTRPGAPSLRAGIFSQALNVSTPSDTGRITAAISADLTHVSSNRFFIRILDWLFPAAVAAPLPDPNQGPGGPILVIDSASSTFGKYYAEILRNEGFNAFTVADITTVTPATLAAYDVVILAGMPLSGAQVTMLSDWVNAGGNLIAMRPDAGLAGLLGLTPTGSTLSNGYLRVDISTSPGNGIVGETIQFHGNAGRYTLSGATEIATLYSSANTATANPAVTLNSVGANGGQAAAFAYDLATSIVYTRQGNPAWAAQERDGLTPPIRSDDKYYGNAIGDPQPDWVDLNKVDIPQADEQQRLLANLIVEMNLDKKPLPRFWYFPRGEKAVVIMTGDDHGNGGTVGRFEQFIARSPAGCNVDNWECVRGTSYIYPNTPMTDAQAAGYVAQGFEVGLHVYTNFIFGACGDFSPTQLENFYTQQISEFTANFPSVPSLSTERHHCIAWSDWVTGAKTELNHGIRLDTDYYFWPPGWVDNRPGLFTGSGMPMRFSDLDGTLIDVYQAATQMTDESGQFYPFTIDTLLDRALGAKGYYGAFTVNAHTDFPQIPEADAVVDSALARGVPIVSSKQMLDWLDGRNSSSFGAMAWNGNALTFTVTPGTGANGLQAFIPLFSSAGAALKNVTRDGSAVSFTTANIKGIEYAFFPATSGTYVATYEGLLPAPTITSRSPEDGATDIVLWTAVTAEFSQGMDASSIDSSTFELRDAGNALVPATVTYIASTQTAMLTPDVPLAASTLYTATVRGGTTDPRVKNLSGNSLAADSSWSFTTGVNTCPCSGWDRDSSITPANPSVNDPNAVELGVKFRTDLAGFITGIRFYKGSGNTAPHTGNLWTSTGQLLATATFTNETASGWQQVDFGAPVEIEANTVYVASYHAPSGNYAGDSFFFANSGVDNGPVHLLQDSLNGGNGVYQYGSGFPTHSFQATNYWVDVVFTTSTGPVMPPEVTATSPADGATDVGIATAITATFSEAMEAATITASTFELRDAGGTLVSAAVTYDAATHTATLTPASAMASSATYTATVKGGTDGAKNLAGNPLAADEIWSFTTAPEGGTPPTVTATSPVDGALDVGVDTAVTATFSEAMDPATIIASTFELRDASNTPVSAAVIYDAATHTATLTPASALAGSATYTATVKGGTDGVKDLAGNPLAADEIWSFTTAPPGAPPEVTAISPADGALDVGVGTVVTATFSEAMDPATITASTFELRDAGNTPVAAAVTYDAATHTATLMPASALASSATYTATVRGGTDGVKDLAGNALATDESWSFTTAPPRTCPCTIWEETTTPSVLADPDTTAIEVGVKFRANVDGLITGIRFYKSATNTGTHVGSLWSSTGQLLASATFINESASGWQQVDFGSPVAITANTVYVASYHTDVGHYSVDENYFAASGVDKGPLHALQDGESGGNGVYVYGAGGFPTNTFRASNYWVDVVFTTSSGPDMTPPEVTATSPADGALEVGIGTAVTATFSEAMEAATITASTFELRDAGGTLVSAAVTYDAATDTATLTPASALASSATYNATIKGGAKGVKDLAGNALAADENWSFTTAPADTTPPTVTATLPADGALGVGVDTVVTVTFNEAMEAASIDSTSFELRDANNTPVSAAVTYDMATDMATLTPASVLTNSAIYTATVKSGTDGVKDLAGNALAADKIWSFTTAPADTTPPEVTATSPADGAGGVGIATVVTATFSEAMDPATITATSFELRDAGNTPVSAAVTYEAATDTAMLTPASALASSAIYTAIVKGGTDGVKDLVGNVLAADESWSFTTAALGTCPCTIWDQSVTPAVLADPDNVAVEVGVKFRTDVDGLITGIRFYKSATNTGPHVGSLWSSTGQLLASANFTNESASGWQQVDFGSPVAITANTVYVASYHTDVGHYSVDENYFTTSGVDKGPLHALQDGESGGNGVYVYGAGGFPTNTFRSSNYWVDVVFTE